MNEQNHDIELQDEHSPDGTLVAVRCLTWPLPDELWVTADLMETADPRFLVFEHEERTDGYHYRVTLTTENVDAVYEAGPQINGIMMFTHHILVLHLVSATRKEV